MGRKRRFTAARRRALRAARRKWMRMSPTARRKAMPGRGKPRKIYPVGQHMLLDIGKPKGHYRFVRKTKWGWKGAKPPKRFLEAGWKEVTHRGRKVKGYVLAPRGRR